MKLTVAYSPCPNDTFMFHAIAEGLVGPSGWQVETHLHDVETLNQWALQERFDVTKISFAAYLRVREQYQLLSAGAALGFGCGPLVVARPGYVLDAPAACRAALPGEMTTAALLFGLWAPAVTHKQFVKYDQVAPAVLGGSADCGVIIHEGRFTYQQANLACLADLGQWWEQQTHLPIPLGCVVARRSLGQQVIADFEAALRRSIQMATDNPAGPAAYMLRHAREMDPSVLTRHVETFVNAFSLDLGPQGRAAIARLEELCERPGRAGLGT